MIVRKEELLDDVDYMARATTWLKKHTLTYELYDVFLIREDIQNAWNELSKEQQTITRAFDREVLRHIDWLLDGEPDLPFVGARMKIDRQYWWWYLHEVKAGTLELPSDLKGAA